MTRVIYANTKNSDMFYALKIPVADPVFFLDLGEKQLVFLDNRELGIFKKYNSNNKLEVVLLDPILEEAIENKIDTSTANKLAVHLLQIYNINNIIVPTSFPLEIADFLRSQNITVTVQNPFHSNRIQKTPQEAEYIKNNLKNLTFAYKKIEEILQNSIIDKKHLYYQNKLLTSEFIKKEVEHILIENDLFDEEGMIISCAEDSAVPHNRGTGPIKAHQPIICDIFPKSRSNGYFADMTRTYVKGCASKEFQKMYETVLFVQEQAIRLVRPGVSARSIYDYCVQAFVERGYDVGEKGFVHGTGHGLGIDIHEEPYVNRHSMSDLEAGNIITIEPGLYYPKIGGVRIEDDILVTKNGYENLTNYPKNNWLLP
jgi:Xaa-Pro aminopeptidase